MVKDKLQLGNDTFSVQLRQLFLIKIMSDGKVSMASRTVTYLRFTDDIGALVEEDYEHEVLAESLDKWHKG